jgi:hypothetical protein
LGGDASFNSDLFVNGNIKLNGQIILNQGFDISGNLTATNIITENSYTNNSNINGALVLGGDASFNGALSVSNNISTTGNIIIGNLTTGNIPNGAGLITNNIYTLNNTLNIAKNTNQSQIQTITIGNSKDDIIILNGNVNILGATNSMGGSQIQSTNTINILGNTAIKNASIAAGIIIGENGLSNAGSIILSNDLNGYIFQPTYGADSATMTSINTVSKRLFMAINDMSLPNTINTGIITLTKALSYNEYDYKMSVGSIDVSNILLKNIATTPQTINSDISFSGITTITNTQVSTSKTTGALTVTGGVGISGDVYMGNLFITSTSQSTGIGTGALQISGGMYVNGNTYMNGVLYMGTSGVPIANTSLDISGNAIISKLGIGTTSVNSTNVLDISGNTRITNGNINFTNGFIVQF